MRKLNIAFLSLLMMLSLVGCMNNDKKETTSDQSEEKKKTETNKEEGSVSDVMNYFKENGIVYDNDKVLSDFDWAAKEGTSFQYNGKSIYLYRVDGSNAQMNEVLNKVKSSNAISANQNGTNKEYSARVNGNYLMIYDQEAAIDELVKIFDKYKYRAKSETSEQSKDAA
ncbi:MAG: hypothetical protein EOM50_03405 [Erysipelotrichia bacterium]|nr:hypothetical protein [Erysipelotrichia bacterium]NCC54889.1 hypothetical protein [Erysipelotrichia bacterium]